MSASDEAAKAAIRKFDKILPARETWWPAIA